MRRGSTVIKMTDLSDLPARYYSCVELGIPSGESFEFPAVSISFGSSPR